MGFADLQQRVMALYERGDFSAALDLLTDEGPGFPERGATVAFFRMCMAARAGAAALALRIFEEALADGHRFPPGELRTDEDLRALQGEPEFERMVEESATRCAAARAAATPSLITVEPPPAAGPPPLLVALHGNHDSAGRSLEHWAALAAAGWLIALPQSSQLARDDGAVWDDRAWAAREVEYHLAALAGRFDPKRLVVAGFSKGGELALWLALAGAVARGFIAVGPSVRDPDDFAPHLAAAAARGLRGTFVLGQQDRPFYAPARALAERCAAAGLACALETHAELGHAFPPDFTRAGLPRAAAFALGDSSRTA